jgi:tripartite-type tricarboxylate transporter receptor subunit TctC
MNGNETSIARSTAMNPMRRRWLVGACAAAALPRALANGDDWPSRPLRLIASGVGGVPDIRARWLAERLTRALAQPVVVENIGGAGGSLGAGMAARSAPDGYTLAIVHQGTLAINPHLNAQLGYDALKDFAPITRCGIGPLLLSVRADAPIGSLRDLVAQAKARPGAMNYGSPGVGSPPHLASELLKRMAGFDATHVPYKGGGALLTDLLGGQITWSFDGPTAQMPHVRSGRLRALAVSGTQRLPALPEVPTVAEAGVPGYEFLGWTGIAAPAATPGPVIARLHAEIAKVLSTAEARDWFASLGAEPGLQTPEEFAAFIRAEYAKWGQVIRDAGIKLE